MRIALIAPPDGGTGLSISIESRRINATVTLRPGDGVLGLVVSGAAAVIQ